MAANLTVSERAYVVKELTLGVTHAQIKQKFPAVFGRTIHMRSIARISLASQSQINLGKETIVREGSTTAIGIKRKTYELIERRVDRALSDDDKIVQLRADLHSGKISEPEFKRKRDLYEEMTINELVKLSDAMHAQGKNEKDDPPSPQDMAALSALMAGIKAGNPVQLIQFLNGRRSENQAA